MLRNIFLVAPLLAFALPLAVPQPSEARPLASQPHQTQWCSSEDGCGDEDDGDSCEDVTVCVYAQIQVCEEDRQSQRDACSDTCALAAANSCAASLGAASVDVLTTCKTDLAARCASDCTRPKTLGIFDPTLGPKKPHPHDNDDNDDHDDHDDHDDNDDNDDHDCDDGDSDEDCVTLEAQACIHVTRE